MVQGSKRPVGDRLNRRILASLRRRLRIPVRLGGLRAALSVLQLAAKAAPTNSTVQIWLGHVAMRATEPFVVRTAIAGALRCTLRSPAEARRIADLQMYLLDADGALDTLNQAASRFPLSYSYWIYLGRLHVLRSRIDEAIDCIQHALDLAVTRTARAKAFCLLAECFDQVGDKKQAISNYQQSLDLVPHRTQPYFYLAWSQRELDAKSEIAERLTRLLHSTSLQPRERRHLHYALGLLHDRSGRPDAAFAHFHLANDLRTMDVPQVNWESRRSDVDARIGLFTRDLIAHWSQYGVPDESLVFIVGMPRSGTTLVEQILDSHPAVHGLGEQVDIQLIAVRSLQRELRSRKPYPWCVKDLTPEVVRELSQRLAQGRRRMAGGSPTRIVTKLPEDFWDLGLIAILFPKARIIHCKRHPIDTCLSCYMQNFEGIPYATGLDSLAETYRLYLRIMEHWRTVIPPSSLFEIDYERLVSHPEEVIGEVCEFCAISLEPSCLRFHENRGPATSCSRWQVREPIYRTSVQRWTAYREFLGPLLALEPESVSAGEAESSDTAFTGNGAASLTEAHVDEPASDQEAARQIIST